MVLIHGHGAVEGGLGDDLLSAVVDAVAQASSAMVDAEVVYIGPERTPMLRLSWRNLDMTPGGRADWMLGQWELQP